jgi:hypothetical protein
MKLKQEISIYKLLHKSKDLEAEEWRKK